MARGIRRALRSAILCAFLAARAVAGDIVGDVRISQPPPPEQNREEYAQSDGGEVVESVPERNVVEEVVVYLEGATTGHGIHPPAVISQRDKTFLPRVLPVRAGTSVSFPNDDRLFHNVFSLAKTNRFDLGRYNTGESRRQTFSKPGVVKLFCEIHPRMRGFIVVLDTDAFTVPDPAGRFRLSGLPDGAYTLVAWHPAFGPKTVPVQVGPRAARIDIQF